MERTEPEERASRGGRLPLRARVERLLGRMAAGALRLFLRVETIGPEEFRRRMPEIRRILLVRPNHRLGNTLLATPAIGIFRRAFPAARIDFLAHRRSMAMLENLPLDEVLPFEQSFFWRPWRLIGFLRGIRSRRYDLAVDCGFGSKIDGLLAAFSGARLRAGAADDRFGFLYHVPVPIPERDLHREARWQRFADHLGIGYRGERMRLVLSRAEEEWAAAWMAANLRPLPEGDGGPPAGIFLGARGRKGKRWPLERFLEAAQLLAGKGRRLLLILGPEERRMREEVRRRLPGGSALADGLSIRQAAALIACCALFITGDSGPMHIACALGVPTLAVFLKDNWRRWGPRPDRGEVFAGAGGRTPAELAERAEAMLSARRPVQSLPGISSGTAGAAP